MFFEKRKKIKFLRAQKRRKNVNLLRRNRQMIHIILFPFCLFLF
jgi:hypothetical protein